MRDRSRRFACTLAVLCGVAVPGTARAQTPPGAGEPRFAPSLAASFGVAKTPNRDRT